MKTVHDGHSLQLQMDTVNNDTKSDSTFQFNVNANKTVRLTSNEDSCASVAVLGSASQMRGCEFLSWGRLSVQTDVPSQLIGGQASGWFHDKRKDQGDIWEGQESGK